MEPAAVYTVLNSYFSHVPTDGQKALLHRISEFLSARSKKDLFVLRGYAGTGKTTLISLLVKARYKLRTKVVLLAPTGRAAKIMGSYADFTSYTIHKKIYKPEENEPSGGVFLRTKNPHKDTLFIIDEASMISGVSDGIYSSSLLDDLIDYVYEQEGCKAIFVGDIAQLPPVGSELSPALIPKYLRNEYDLRIDGIELKDVVRQRRESGILYNATRLREFIEEERYEVMFQTNFEDVQTVDGIDLQEVLEDNIGEFGEENVVVICRSNKRANLFNQQIRSRVLWKEEELSAGDLMMVVKNNYSWLDSKSKVGFIANGDTVEILQVKRKEEMYGYNFADVVIRLIDYPEEKDLEVKVLMDVIHQDGPSLDQRSIEDLFRKVYEDYLDEPDGGKRLLKVKEDPYYNALQVKFAYAVTCHKSQGGQWPVVLIDQGYLTDEMIDKNLLRWMYTAVTRATEKLYLVNFNKQFIE